MALDTHIPEKTPEFAGRSPSRLGAILHWPVFFLKTKITVLRAFALALVAVFVSASCQAPPTGKLPEVARDAPGFLAPGDIIKLTFPGTPELSQSQKIRPDGRISLPLVGEVKAAGKKFASFQDELGELYKPQLKNTEVVISLESSATPVVIVDGAVRKPGGVPCDHPLTMFEALMQSGGFAPEADLKRVQLIRLVKGEHRSQFVDLRGAMTGAPIGSIPVVGGDIIFVPEKYFRF